MLQCTLQKRRQNELKQKYQNGQSNWHKVFNSWKFYAFKKKLNHILWPIQQENSLGKQTSFGKLKEKYEIKIKRNKNVSKQMIKKRHIESFKRLQSS